MPRILDSGDINKVFWISGQGPLKLKHIGKASYQLVGFGGGSYWAAPEQLGREASEEEIQKFLVALKERGVVAQDFVITWGEGLSELDELPDHEELPLECPPEPPQKTNKVRTMDASHWVTRPGEFYFCVSEGDELTIKIGRDAKLKRYVLTVPDLQWESRLMDADVRTLEVACKIASIMVSAELGKMETASRTLYDRKVPKNGLRIEELDLDAPVGTKAVRGG